MIMSLKLYDFFYYDFLATDPDSRSYQIFWEVVGPERVPLSFTTKTEELL
jgi:hypothetical protein